MNFVVVTLLLLTGFSGTHHSDACKQWQAKVGRLTEAEKTTLGDAGAVYTSDRVLISDRVVSNCQVRLAIGQYIYDALVGRVSPDDRRVASLYSPQIRMILESIWPGLSNHEVISDGARGEIYTAMLYLRAPDRLRLVREVLGHEGLTLALVDVIIRSNMTELGSSLLREAKATNNQTQQVYAFATLAGLKNPAGAGGLSRLLSTRSLPPQQAKVVSKILQKSKSNQRITSEDLIELEYED
jgi:hypothetical protein